MANEENRADSALDMLRRKSHFPGGGLSPDAEVLKMALTLPTSFIECEQCGGAHKPVAGVCGSKLEKDAAFVLHACGTGLSQEMIGRVLREVGGAEGHRYVSHPAQRHAYLLTGAYITRGPRGRKFAADGAEWVARMDYPPDVLLIEAGGSHGLIKALFVKDDWVA